MDYDGDGERSPGDLRKARGAGVFWGPAKTIQVSVLDDNLNTITRFVRSTLTTAPGVSNDLSDGFNMTLDFIAAGDGQAQTLLLSENIQATAYAYKGSTLNFPVRRIVRQISFGVPVEPFVTINDPNDPRSGSLTLTTTFNGSNTPFSTIDVVDANGNPASAHINDDLSTVSVGERPRPSSNHQGAVNVAWSDGRASALNNQIDQKVYARLLTPDGQRLGQRIDNSQN